MDMNTDKSRELRIIVAGGRDFDNYSLVVKEVTRVMRSLLDVYGLTEEDVRIVSGHARGTDTMGEALAGELGLNLTIFPANWIRYKKSAGAIRNQTMGDYAVEGDNIGCLIAFWDGNSRGTKNMIDIAEKLDMDVTVCMY